MLTRIVEIAKKKCLNIFCELAKRYRKNALIRCTLIRKHTNFINILCMIRFFTTPHNIVDRKKVNENNCLRVKRKLCTVHFFVFIVDIKNNYLYIERDKENL